MRILLPLAFFFSAIILIQGSEPSQFVTQLKAGKKQTVVAYGTSLTAHGAWVHEVAETLNNKFPDLVTMVNSGGAGKWSEWGVQQLDSKVLKKTPNAVFLEFSINDSVERFHGSTHIAKTNLETMILRIQKAHPDCEIILMTMTPGNKHPEGHRSYRKEIENHYQMYRNVAKHHGFLLIDHYLNWKSLQKTNNALFRKYVPDTIHPTPEGCSKIVTPVILKAIGLPTK